MTPPLPSPDCPKCKSLIKVAMTGKGAPYSGGHTCILSTMAARGPVQDQLAYNLYAKYAPDVKPNPAAKRFAQISKAKQKHHPPPPPSTVRRSGGGAGSSNEPLQQEAHGGDAEADGGGAEAAVVLEQVHLPLLCLLSLPLPLLLLLLAVAVPQAAHPLTLSSTHLSGGSAHGRRSR